MQAAELRKKLQAEKDFWGKIRVLRALDREGKPSGNKEEPRK